MKNNLPSILILGVGRSAYYTVEYLSKQALKGDIVLTIADVNPQNLSDFVFDGDNINKVLLSQDDTVQRNQLIAKADVVISILPALLHDEIAEVCLAYNTHLITPSYQSPYFQSIKEKVKQKELIFINEMGLDPGIDHLSAMQIIDNLQHQGANITSFKSYCGGLIDRACDDNPFHYKISWSPYNIIRAGNAGAVYKEDNGIKFLPYHKLFRNYESISLKKTDEVFHSYYNRNSIPYIDLYGLNTTDTFIRGTLRYPDFMKYWQELIDCGLTNDSIVLDLDIFSLKKFFNLFNLNLLSKDILRFLDFESEFLIPFKHSTPANILQWILGKKWALSPSDKDRVVMIHQFGYTLNNEQFLLQSELDVLGEDAHKTAMAKTVGLPLAHTAMAIIEGSIQTKGVRLPTEKEIYQSVLPKLSLSGITFEEYLEKI